MSSKLEVRRQLLRTVKLQRDRALGFGLDVANALPEARHPRGQ